MVTSWKPAAALVGAILMICSAMRAGDRLVPRCNLSSWYVEPAFRTYAPLLVSQALRHKDVTYMNVSAAPHTWPIIEAQGFARYSEGIFVCLPALQRTAGGEAVEVLGADSPPAIAVDAFEREILLQHAEHGCIGLWCVSAGRAYPFVFRPRLVKGFIPCAQLIYCRDIADFARFAGPIGRYLARRGRVIVHRRCEWPDTGTARNFPPRQQAEIFQRPAAPAARRSRLYRIRHYGRLALQTDHTLGAPASAIAPDRRHGWRTSAKARRSTPKATQPVCAAAPDAVRKFQVAPKWSR